MQPDRRGFGRTRCNPSTSPLLLSGNGSVLSPRRHTCSEAQRTGQIQSDIQAKQQSIFRAEPDVTGATEVVTGDCVADSWSNADPAGRLGLLGAEGCRRCSTETENRAYEQESHARVDAPKTDPTGHRLHGSSLPSNLERRGAPAHRRSFRLRPPAPILYLCWLSSVTAEPCHWCWCSWPQVLLGLRCSGSMRARPRPARLQTISTMTPRHPSLSIRRTAGA
jgi:hypothetical protein